MAKPSGNFTNTSVSAGEFQASMRYSDKRRIYSWKAVANRILVPLPRKGRCAMRFVTDLSNFDNSLMEIPTGESGQYASPHYRDQFPEWFAGRGVAAPFSENAEEAARAHRLILLPAGANTQNR